MDQIKENKKDVMETMRKYGEMPINPERAAFLADCWAAYRALCTISEETADLDNDAQAGKK